MSWKTRSCLTKFDGSLMFIKHNKKDTVISYLMIIIHGNSL
jgi:hypothetical protein